MQKTWFYIDSQRQQQGPISPDDLALLAEQGQVTPESYVWTEELDKWIRASKVDGLFPIAEKKVTSQTLPKPSATATTDNSVTERESEPTEKKVLKKTQPVTPRKMEVPARVSKRIHARTQQVRTNLKNKGS